MTIIEGNIVDVVNRRVFPGKLTMEDGYIAAVTEEPANVPYFIIPGFIDAHVHIESSMLVPSSFARLAVVHGTVAAVSDPHEIANVLGIAGVRYMMENGKKVPFRFFFGAPSCVPATPFETAGAAFGLAETEEVLRMPEVLYLSEMMNVPGVLHRDPEVMGKLALAARYAKKVDGHAPGLRGEDLVSYAGAGISSDHECFTYEEAKEKIDAGMMILIREGSAARNFEALAPLISEYPDRVMLCSDDKHPDDLVEGHINKLASRAIRMGYDWMSVLRACSFNPVKHYGLGVGLLQPGDPADFLLVNSLSELEVLETWIGGTLVARGGNSLIPDLREETPNIFRAQPVSTGDLKIPAQGTRINVQKALDGQLITESIVMDARIEGGYVTADTSRDILKMLVLNRYEPALPAISFVHNFGLTHGAIASTVAHDSHNIIAVGASDEELTRAVNLVIREKGGISLVSKAEEYILPLPVAGLMSNDDGYRVASGYARLDKLAKSLGSGLRSPYMTLSFMALLVIPALKLSDKGLFDGNKFTFKSLFAD